jgi:nucleotide-binding universal stress UspA family protein
MKIILAALDLEVRSNAVTARAGQLAATHATQLVLLHVIEREMLSYVAGVSGRSEAKLQDELRQPTLTRLGSVLSEIGRSPRIASRVEFGSPHEVITRVAREISADLIMIGRGKKQSLKEMVLGSTADRVIRTSPAPVLLVRRQSVKPYMQLVVAVDFSPQSAAAAREARKLAPEGRITLIHVDDIPPSFEQLMLRAGTSQTAIEEYRSARISKASQDLTGFAREVMGSGKTHMRILQGVPGIVFARLSRRSCVELLALGPHGRNIVLQALLGSVTQRVLRKAECDVLVSGAR